MQFKRASALVFALGLATLGSMSQFAEAQPAGYNYDEAKVPKYTLPDPLALPEGGKVIEADTWRQRRRPEILELYRRHMYGRAPKSPGSIRYEVVETDLHALGGIAVRKQVNVYLTGDKDGPKMELLIYLPANPEKPVPAFLGLNFNGNHGVNADPAIRLSPAWFENNKERGVTNNQATDKGRGSEASRWPVAKIVGRGYALATVYYGDLEPDHAEGWKHGIRSVIGAPKPGGQFLTDDWGAIGAWAWGLSRALDYLEKDPAIDAKHVAVIGHSRLGKTSLWAGAEDQRFAAVISNNSGEGGAAITRRKFGETITRLNTSFPHWFCGNFKSFNEAEDTLPVDQHMLISLMAPRPVYVASAQEDLWADPKGEFLAAYWAGPVYDLFGKKGLPSLEMPPLNKPVGDTVGYHIRTGKHDVTDYDWDQYLDFTDRHFHRSALK